MTVGTVLNDGRYLFRNDLGQLFLEDISSSNSLRRTKKERESFFSLIFGGNTLDFAVQEEHQLLAILCESFDEVYLAIFEFKGDEIQSPVFPIGDYKMNHGASTLLWVGGKHSVGAGGNRDTEKLYIAVSDHHRGTQLYHVDLNRRTLHMCENVAVQAMQSSGAVPFVSMHYLCVVDPDTDNLYFLDVRHQSVVETHCLKGIEVTEIEGDELEAIRSIRYTSSTSDKNFLFLGFGGGSIFGAYVTKGSVRILSPVLEDFKLLPSPSPLWRAECDAAASLPLSLETMKKNADWDLDPQGELKKQDDRVPALPCTSLFPSLSSSMLQGMRIPSSKSLEEWGVSPHVVCCALSTAQVVVAMDQVVIPFQESIFCSSNLLSGVQRELNTDDQGTDTTEMFDTNTTFTKYPPLKVILYKYIKADARLTKIKSAHIPWNLMRFPAIEFAHKMDLKWDQSSAMMNGVAVYTVIALGTGGKDALVRCQVLVRDSTSPMNPSSVTEEIMRGEMVVLPAPTSLPLRGTAVVWKELFYVVPLHFNWCEMTEAGIHPPKRMDHLKDEAETQGNQAAVAKVKKEESKRKEPSDQSDVSTVKEKSTAVDSKKSRRALRKERKKARAKGEIATEVPLPMHGDSPNVSSSLHSQISPKAMTQGATAVGCLTPALGVFIGFFLGCMYCGRYRLKK